MVVARHRACSTPGAWIAGWCTVTRQGFLALAAEGERKMNVVPLVSRTLKLLSEQDKLSDIDHTVDR